MLHQIREAPAGAEPRRPLRCKQGTSFACGRSIPLVGVRDFKSSVTVRMPLADALYRSFCVRCTCMPTHAHLPPSQSWTFGTNGSANRQATKPNGCGTRCTPCVERFQNQRAIRENCSSSTITCAALACASMRGIRWLAGHVSGEKRTDCARGFPGARSDTKVCSRRETTNFPIVQFVNETAASQQAINPISLTSGLLSISSWCVTARRPREGPRKVFTVSLTIRP